jgi:hypothetical protein
MVPLQEDYATDLEYFDPFLSPSPDRPQKVKKPDYALGDSSKAQEQLINSRYSTDLA